MVSELYSVIYLMYKYHATTFKKFHHILKYSTMINTTQTLSILVLIFRGENYDYWSIKMKKVFCSQDLWNIVEE